MGLKNLQKLAGVTPPVDTTKKVSNPFDTASTPDKPSGTMGFLGGQQKKSFGEGFGEGGVSGFLANAGKAIGGFGIGAAKSLVKLPQQAAAFGADIGTRMAAAVRPDATYEQLKSAEAGGGMAKAVERPEWTKAHGAAEKVGETAGDIAQFFVPGEGAAKAIGKAAEIIPGVAKAGEALKGVGEAAKALPFAEKAMPFVGKSLKEAADMFAKTGIQTGDTKEAAIGGITGLAMPAAGAVLKGLGNVGKQVVETISSKLSGVPKEAIEHAIANPDAVRSAIRAMAKDPAMGGQKVLENATEAFDAMKSARREAYRAGLKKVEDETVKDAAGNWMVKKGNQLVPIDLSAKSVQKKLYGTLENFGAVVKDGKVDMSKMALPSAQKKELQEVVEKLQSWDDFSPTGIDDLRENIAVFKKGGIAQSSADRKFNKIVEDTLGDLRKYIGEQVPQIAEMNQQYHAMLEPLERIAQELRLEKNPVTAMRKLTNAFSPKSAVYRDLIKELGEKGSKDLLSDIAGLLMSKWTPEGLGGHITALLAGEGGLAAFAHPAVLPGMAVTGAMASPRIVGETAVAAGKAAEAIKPALPAIKQAGKGAISESIRK